MDEMGTGGRAGARVLRTDVRVAALLGNYARRRTIARMFGASPEQANLVTMVAVLAIAQATSEYIQRLAAGPPVPSATEGLFVSASLKELLSSVAGPPSRETPSAGTLLALALVGGTAGPAVFRSTRAARSASRRMATGFHHRYGYLVDPGHWRQQRALRRARGAQRAPRVAAAPAATASAQAVS